MTSEKIFLFEYCNASKDISVKIGLSSFVVINKLFSGFIPVYEAEEYSHHKQYKNRQLSIKLLLKLSSFCKLNHPTLNKS